MREFGIKERSNEIESCATSKHAFLIGLRVHEERLHGEKIGIGTTLALSGCRGHIS